jgi:tetratricopeptide (TPR) repeat protein
MKYWNYYWMLMLASYLLQQPKLLIGLLALVLLRRVLPAPGPIFRALGRRGALRNQLQLNPKNATAARDLAELELDLLRPGAALRWLDLALARCPDEAELLYLSGLALYRLRRYDEALSRLIASVHADARVRFGLAYLVAGDALLALRRWDEALDAYERYEGVNSSDLRGYLGMARAHHRLGNRQAAAEQVQEALRTYGLLPRHLRSSNFGARLSTFWFKVWKLREPKAIGQALGLAALATAGSSILGLGATIVWTAISDLDEPEFDLEPEACEELAERTPRSVAHLACLAKKVTFNTTYMEPSSLDVDAESLREYGIDVTRMQGLPSYDESTPNYMGYQIAIAGTTDARFVVYNEALNHRFKNIDFTDTALKAPVRIIYGEKLVTFEGADGQRRMYVGDQGNCAEMRDAGGDAHDVALD